MSHCQALEEWTKKAQVERGLVNVNFFPGFRREQDLEAAAEGFAQYLGIAMTTSAIAGQRGELLGRRNSCQVGQPFRLDARLPSGEQFDQLDDQNCQRSDDSHKGKRRVHTWTLTVDRFIPVSGVARRRRVFDGHHRILGVGARGRIRRPFCGVDGTVDMVVSMDSGLGKGFDRHRRRTRFRRSPDEIGDHPVIHHAASCATIGHSNVGVSLSMVWRHVKNPDGSDERVSYAKEAAAESERSAGPTGGSA
jgi:hypothetical protein